MMLKRKIMNESDSAEVKAEILLRLTPSSGLEPGRVGMTSVCTVWQAVTTFISLLYRCTKRIYEQFW